jgi:hypothetical protein
VLLLNGKPLEAGTLGLARSAIAKEDESAGASAEDASTEANVRFELTHRIEEVEVVEQEVTTVQALQCVNTFNSITRDGSGDRVHGAVLARALAHSANLWGIPQSLDLQNEIGERVTIGTWHKSVIDGNEERLFYVREDVLREYLRAKNMKLVWVIWGERSRSYGRGMAEISSKDLSYGVFQSVRTA